jgi:ribonuclease P protein component
MANLSHGKEEKLKSRKAIELLFEQGASTFAFPVKMFYSIQSTTEEQNFPQIGVSVSKRRHKRATDRNTIKRRLREAYRLNSVELKPIVQDHHIDALFVYVSPLIEDYAKIEAAIKKHIKFLIKKIDGTGLN